MQRVENFAGGGRHCTAGWYFLYPFLAFCAAADVTSSLNRSRIAQTRTPVSPCASHCAEICTQLGAALFSLFVSDLQPAFCGLAVWVPLSTVVKYQDWQEVCGAFEIPTACVGSDECPAAWDLTPSAKHSHSLPP